MIKTIQIRISKIFLILLILFLTIYVFPQAHAVQSNSTNTIYYSVHVARIPPGTHININDEGKIYSTTLYGGYTLLMAYSGDKNIQFPLYYPGNSYVPGYVKALVRELFINIITKVSPENVGEGHGVIIYYINKDDNNKLYICKDPLVGKGRNFEIAFNNQHIPLRGIVELDTNDDGLSDIIVVFDVLYSNTRVCGHSAYTQTKAYIPLAGTIIVGIASITSFKRFR